MKKLCSLLFALLLLFACVACTVNDPGDDSNGTKTPIADGGDDDRLSASDGLPDTKFNGARYRVSCTDWFDYEVFAEDTQDVCDAAVYNRNIKIEDRFDVEIVPVVTPMGNQLNHEKEIRRILDAGDDAFDIIMMQVFRSGTLAIDGYFRNWYDNIPGVNLEQPWWTQYANADFTVNGALYVAAGDMSLTSLVGTQVYLYNKDMATDLQIENLYDVVREDKWTIDYVHALVKDIYTDLNHNDVRDAEDSYGFVSGTSFDASAYLPASNMVFVGVDDYGELALTLDEQKADTLYTKVHDLFMNNSGSYAILTDGEFKNKFTMFSSGNVLISSQSLSYLYGDARDMTAAYGVLPYPKYDEQQTQYYSGLSSAWSVLCIPINETDLKMVGYITEALNCENYRTVFPAYYDVALKDKYTDSSDDEEMLDIILAGRRSDLAVLYSPTLDGLSNIFKQLLQAQSDTFQTEWNSKKSGYIASLSKLEKAYMDMANAA